MSHFLRKGDTNSPKRVSGNAELAPLLVGGEPDASRRPPIEGCGRWVSCRAYGILVEGTRIGSVRTTFSGTFGGGRQYSQPMPDVTAAIRLPISKARRALYAAQGLA